MRLRSEDSIVIRDKGSLISERSVWPLKPWATLFSMARPTSDSRLSNPRTEDMICHHIVFFLSRA